MKKSIRRRITLAYAGLLALTIALIFGFNMFFLEAYYTRNKMQNMEQAYEEINRAVMERVSGGEKIDELIRSDLEREWAVWNRLAEKRSQSGENGEKLPARRNSEVLDEETRNMLDSSFIGSIRKYSEKNNITLILVDSETSKVMLNFGREGDFLAQKLQRHILGQSDSADKLLQKHENYVIERNFDRRFSMSYLECWGFFGDNNTLFLMQMPLVSIRDSVALANRFIAVVGLAVLLFGGILMYFMSRRLTGPIMNLAALSERMSNLDFDARYEGREKDEIGVLGNSMNAMSERLKETISELREANVKLQHDIQEKIEIDDMRKEFIANVSHELKTPIALIQGYAEGLTEGMAEDEESRNYYCEVIMDEANKMNKMVRQLLTLTALEFGNDTPVFETFDICSLIRDLTGSASILMQQNEAELKLDLPDCVPVYADEFKIEEVLTNYFNNAINHLSGERKIAVSVETVGELAKITVFNNGQPIPEEAIPNLWTKFYKVDKARTRAYGGSGIGLSIVKAIIDAHHQTCGVENRPDGVAFWFTLPLAKRPQGAE